VVVTDIPLVVLVAAAAVEPDQTVELQRLELPILVAAEVVVELVA